MESIVESWSLIGDSYYIKYHFFNMSWNMIVNNFKDYLIAHESYGGSIAAISKSANQELMVFSPSGHLTSSVIWKDPTVIGLHWSDDENLFLLQRSGRVAIHNLHGDYIKYVSMGNNVQENLVKTFRFFNSLQGVGLMVVTERNELFYKNNLKNTDCETKRFKAAKQCLIDPIIDWVAFIDTTNRDAVAIFSCKSGLIKLRPDEDPQILNRDHHWLRENALITRLSIDQSERRLAIAMNNGVVRVVRSDLTESIVNCEFDVLITEGDYVQLEWAGSDCVALFHRDYIYLLDTAGQTSSCLYLEEPIMFPEIDGVRLISATKHEFIQKIPHELEQLYQFSSESPAMLLFEAQQHLDNKRGEAVSCLELLLSKDGHMHKAIDICLSAASHCLEPKWQKTILRAVHLGRSYYPEYRSDKIEDIHKKLLLLNNLKVPYIAMPVTMFQLEKMTVKVLLDRLINRHFYPFVERICFQLRIPKEEGINRMLDVWANKYIERGDDEYLLANKIIARLENHMDFDFAKIASKACDLNKKVLAEKLLDREKNIQNQVRVLMKLKNYNTALSRSIESGDCDLISSVVSKLHSCLGYDDFISLIRKYPVAKTMHLENMMDSNNQESDMIIRRLNEVDDNLENKIDGHLKNLIKSENLSTALSEINNLQDIYRKRNNEFMLQILDEQKILYERIFASAKTSDTDMSRVSTSVYDYLSILFQNKHYDKAENFKQKLKISDRQFYWLKLNVCAQMNHWDDFSATVSKWNRKAPISYYDIGEICADNNNERLLYNYMDKIEPDKRVRLLVKMNKLQEAEELAKMIKNEYLIHYVAALKY